MRIFLSISRACLYLFDDSSPTQRNIINCRVDIFLRSSEDDDNTHNIILRPMSNSI